MIIHFIHWNADTLQTGSRLLLSRAHARWRQLRQHLLHRINRHFARQLRQRTAYFRLLDGRAAGNPRWPMAGDTSHPSRSG